MIEALPWIVFLAVVAAAAGYVAGRRSLKSSPPDARGYNALPSNRTDATALQPSAMPQPKAVPGVSPGSPVTPVTASPAAVPAARRSSTIPTGDAPMTNAVANPAGLLGQG